MGTNTRARANRWLVLLAGIVAVWAFAGAAGLGSGVISLGSAVEGRLPWHSPTFAAVMLALIVGLPMAATSYLAAAADRRAGTAALVSGAALIGWILVQLALIRTGSWLQPICVALGVTILALGARLR
ncbi:hypothetical protein [Nocardia pseudobrasiliensis]|uniref:Uncharacterized protein n=1 Tax=Nocardia pseudobrasiliensis TaxID=45979 RepID=A0A370IC26_9NOCA|nr:hypothetical protein [Nocardia pseudobrasiliensis]RDI68276.1 hypothetical protein DFR76_102677 [Nocardia pseudobrasiliensis]